MSDINVGDLVKIRFLEGEEIKVLSVGGYYMVESLDHEGWPAVKGTNHALTLLHPEKVSIIRVDKC